MRDFRTRVLGALSWSAFLQVATQGLTLAFAVVLSRMLSPRDFGLLAMVGIFTGFAQVLCGFGMGEALVQRQELGAKHLSVTFWANLSAGVFLAVFFSACSCLIAKFFNNPALTPLTCVLAIDFVIRPLSVVHLALLQKRLDFKALSAARVLGIVVSGLLAIALAQRGCGVWSLAAKTLSASALSTLLLWRSAAWRPSLSIEWSAINDLRRFGASVLGTQALDYWATRIDDLLIGKVLGSNALGIYARCYTFLCFPLRNVSGVFARVMFPSLSAIQSQKARVKRLYLRTAGGISLITFPLMIGLGVTADHFVMTLLGIKWAGMIPLLRIFCLTGLVNSINTLNGNLYLSQGRSDLQLRVSLLTKPVLIAGIIVGLHWGLQGVAVGFSVAVLVVTYPQIFFAGRLVGLSVLELARSLSGVLGCAIGMASVVLICRSYLPVDWSHGFRLVILATIGALCYWGLLHVFCVSAYKDVVAVVSRQWRGGDTRNMRTGQHLARVSFPLTDSEHDDCPS